LSRQSARANQAVVDVWRHHNNWQFSLGIQQDEDSQTFSIFFGELFHWLVKVLRLYPATRLDQERSNNTWWDWRRQFAWTYTGDGSAMPYGHTLWSLSYFNRICPKPNRVGRLAMAKAKEK